MNPVIIILGVIVLLLLYYLYTKYIVSPSEINKYSQLSNGSVNIAYANLTNGGAANYYYGAWVYVNTWNSQSSKTIISRSSGAMGSSSTSPDFWLWLDSNTPTLKAFIQNSKTAVAPNGSDGWTVNITNNFPIQSWVYVVVSVQGTVMDVYLNGKLVSSTQLPGVPLVSKNGIYLGDVNNPDIYLSKVSRIPNAIDPQTAWQNYLGGNGVSSTGGSYNVQLQLLQNNSIQKNWKIY